MNNRALITSVFTLAAFFNSTVYGQSTNVTKIGPTSIEALQSQVQLDKLSDSTAKILIGSSNTSKTMKEKLLDPKIESMLKQLMGGVNGGGGDEVGLKFQSVIQTALQNLKSWNNSFFTEHEKQIEMTIERMKIIVVDDTLDVKLKGLIQASVAVNFPEFNLIIVNRVRWKNIQEAALLEGIALHEVLSLMEIEMTGFYPISSKYVSSSGVQSTRLSAALNINRLEQIKAMDPNRSAFELLEKLYEDASEPLTWDDIKTVSSNVNIQCHTIILSEWRDNISPNLISKPYFFRSRINFYYETLKHAVEDRGPLFPAEPAVEEPRFRINRYAGWEEAPKGAQIHTSSQQIEQKNVDNVVFDSGSKIKITNHTESIRKNNGWLVHNIYWLQEQEDGRMSSHRMYGYCYPSP